MKRLFAAFAAAIMLVTVFTSCFQRGPKISMIDSTKTLIVGKTYTLQYKLNSTDSNEQLIWTSSDEDVATVENGTVTAHNAGTSEIKVTTSDNQTAVCNLTVKDIEITRVTVTPNSVSLKKDESETLETQIYPAKAGDIDVTWSSSDPSVASVSSDGTVTAVGAGTATITASVDSGKSGSAAIKVTAKKKKKKSSNNTTIVNYHVYSDAPRRIGDDYTDDFVFSDSSYRYLSDYEVDALGDDETQLAINEIYARNGHAFSESRWRNYFNQYDWYYYYSPKKKVSQSDCNSYERANLNKLIKHRDALK